MHHVLLAVDESDGSRRAAEFVERLFADHPVAVTAVTVARTPVSAMAPGPYGGVFTWPCPRGRAELLSVERALEREEIVAGAVATLQAPTANDTRVLFGEPVSAICRAAEDENVDLVVLGSNKRGRLRRFLRPSVSEAVARKARRPVLIVR